MGGAQVDWHRGRGCLTAEQPRTKDSSHFMDPEVRGWVRGHGGQAGRGKVLGTESEWEKVYKSPHPLPNKEALVEMPKEDLSPRPLVKRPRNRGVWARNANVLRAGAARGPEGWTATPFRDCAPSLVWGGQLPWEAHQVKPL